MRRAGYTLIEVMLAIIVLAVVLMSLARYTGSLLHTVSTSNARTTAAEVARERIELVKSDPSYLTLATSWAGAQTGFPGYPSMRRTTTVQRVTGTAPPRDYTIITVQVTEPTMGLPVNVTTVVGRP
jgi:prepilin-type N-terminal cleavage/methylation domain-containing protein